MVDGKVIINRWTENPSSIAIVGDVLITCKGAGVGKMAYMDIAKAHVARQVMAIRPHCNIPSKFIETVLQGQFTKIREQMNGLIPSDDCCQSPNFLGQILIGICLCHSVSPLSRQHKT